MTPEPRWETVLWADLSRDTLYALLVLRQEVFVVEQCCPYQDADGLDPRAVHVLGWHGERLVACARLFGPGVTRDEAVIGRVITHSSVRGQGLGRPLMREALAATRKAWGAAPVFVSAQAHLEGFYASLGFSTCGPSYLEDDIPHLPMLRETP